MTTKRDPEPKPPLVPVDYETEQQDEFEFMTPAELDASITEFEKSLPPPTRWPLPVDYNTPMDDQEMLSDEEWEALLASENPPTRPPPKFLPTGLGLPPLWLTRGVDSTQAA
jgi:hypothetical protein